MLSFSWTFSPGSKESLRAEVGQLILQRTHRHNRLCMDNLQAWRCCCVGLSGSSVELSYLSYSAPGNNNDCGKSSPNLSNVCHHWKHWNCHQMTTTTLCPPSTDVPERSSRNLLNWLPLDSKTEFIICQPLVFYFLLTSPKFPSLNTWLLKSSSKYPLLPNLKISSMCPSRTESFCNELHALSLLSCSIALVSLE